MLFEKPEEKPKREENLVPLINIVFLMLIFFLITTTLKPFDKADISLAATKELKNSKVRRDVILITAEGSIMIDGIATPEDALVAAFAPWQARSSADNPMMLVADKNLSADKLVTVLEAASSAGVKYIKLVTKRSGRS